MSVKLQGKNCILREWEVHDLELLYMWRNSKDYLDFCSLRKVSNSFDEFKDEFYQDLNIDRQDQFIILRKADEIEIGTIFLYGLNIFHQNAFITTFIDESMHNKGYGVEAFAIFCIYAFEKYNLHKIISDVYSNNSTVPKMLKYSGFVEEGRFKEHRKNSRGEWLDVIRLSLFNSDALKLKLFVTKITQEC